VAFADSLAHQHGKGSYHTRHVGVVADELDQAVQRGQPLEVPQMVASAVDVVALDQYRDQ
jgi:hypothetical protein